MLSKKQKHSSHGSHGKEPEPSSDLSRHYHQIGIKAVYLCGGAERPSAGSDRKKENRTKEDTDE
jgi:hypothetical protein